MPEAAPSNLSEAVQAHRAESDRLGRITEFLKEFAPAIGEARQPGQAADVPSDLSRARESAIIASFEAVERIALESFRFQKGQASCPEPRRTQVL